MKPFFPNPIEILADCKLKLFACIVAVRRDKSLHGVSPLPLSGVLFIYKAFACLILITILY